MLFPQQSLAEWTTTIKFAIRIIVIREVTNSIGNKDDNNKNDNKDDFNRDDNKDNNAKDNFISKNNKDSNNKAKIIMTIMTIDIT